MNDPIQSLRERVFPGDPATFDRPAAWLEGLDGLQVLAGKLLLFTGVATTVEALGVLRRAEATPASARADTPAVRLGLPAAWAPAILGPLAAAAHMAHAIAPSERTRLATQLLDVAAVGAGFAVLAGALASGRRDAAVPSMSAVALSSAGALGLLLDRSEREHADEVRGLEKRAAVVERLVPRRRSKLDRIVVHV